MCGPLITRLRQRTGITRLVKVKSHQGLWTNAQADAAAASASQTESPGSLLWQGPVKPDFLVVKVHPGVWDAIREEGTDVPLPGNLVANKTIFLRMGALQESTIAL